MVAAAEVVGSIPEGIGESDADLLVFRAKNERRSVNHDGHRPILFTTTDGRDVSTNHPCSRQHRPFGGIGALPNSGGQLLPQFDGFVVMNVLPALRNVPSDRSGFAVAAESMQDGGDN